MADRHNKLAHLEAAQRISRVGSWELDTSSHEMFWSEETYRILGLAPSGDKTSLESFSRLVDSEGHRSVMEQLLEAVEAGRPFDLSYRAELASGSTRYVQLRGELVSDRPGRLRGTIQDVTEQRQAQDEIRRLAHFDSLTGLSNRRRFTEQLERSMDRARIVGHRMALLYMDLDQFKRINDTLGHSAGDHLLEHVARVLFDKVRTTDIIARNVGEDAEAEVSRLGGDEFAVLLSEISSEDDVRRIAERILDGVTDPISFDEHSISTTVSIGIAIFPDDGENVETLVKHADTAMYKAKERGRNLYEFFSHEMNEGILRKLTLETQLRHALERNELRVVYQPRVDIRQRRVVGVEALLRWNPPKVGPVQPREFIPVAEETGLIVPIGAWVLQTACAQAKAWRVAGYGKVQMSVNVSSRQFVHHDIRASVIEALKSSGLDPHQLELEITESVLLEDNPDTADALRELKAMGVRLALDDFGTGYSSVSYLTRMPLDTLKLDRSLVRDVGSDPTARRIATALIGMAHAMNLSVTAEGVDQVEQALCLQEERCDELQGFLISAPVPAEECQRLFPGKEGSSGFDWDAMVASAESATKPQAPGSSGTDLPAFKPAPQRDRRRRSGPAGTS